MWDILIELGYQADGFYVGLGIGEYSDVSGDYTRAFAEERGLTLRTIDLRDEYGYDVPDRGQGHQAGAVLGVWAVQTAPVRQGGARRRLRRRRHRPQSRRRSRRAVRATLLRWDIEYLARQHPVLPARNGFPKKVKPLMRLTEREMAAWCIVRGIDYQVEECPMALGNKHLAYKDALNSIEKESPGSKSAFYLNFVDKMSPLLAGQTAGRRPPNSPCATCAVHRRPNRTSDLRLLCVLPPARPRARRRAGTGRTGAEQEGPQGRSRGSGSRGVNDEVRAAGDRAILLDAKKRRYLLDRWRSAVSSTRTPGSCRTRRSSASTTA